MRVCGGEEPEGPCFRDGEDVTLVQSTLSPPAFGVLCVLPLRFPTRIPLSISVFLYTQHFRLAPSRKPFVYRYIHIYFLRLSCLLFYLPLTPLYPSESLNVALKGPRSGLVQNPNPVSFTLACPAWTPAA